MIDDDDNGGGGGSPLPLSNESKSIGVAVVDDDEDDVDVDVDNNEAGEGLDITEGVDTIEGVGGDTVGVGVEVGVVTDAMSNNYPRCLGDKPSLSLPSPFSKFNPTLTLYQPLPYPTLPHPNPNHHTTLRI